MNKHPLLSWRAFALISMLLVIVYAVMLTCNYENRNAHWITTSSIGVFLLILTHATIIYASSNQYVPNGPLPVFLHLS